MSKPHRFVLACAIACALVPAEARADAIGAGALAVAGGVILIPLIVFTMFVEGIPLARGLRIPYRRTLIILMIANLVSLSAGYPVKYLNAMLYRTFMPCPLVLHVRMYPVAAVLSALNFFAVTLAIELGIIALWCKRRQIHVGRKKLLRIVAIMNVMTYVVLAPLNYFFTTPRHGVNAFTDGSSWAQRPPAEIYYIATDGNLCAIMTDGSSPRVIIRDDVKSYQYLPRPGLFLYRNWNDALCLFRESDGQTVECWQTSRQYHMDEVTCSPDGKTVAYLEALDDEESCLRLMLFDTDTRQRYPTEITNECRAELLWGESPDILFLRNWDKPVPILVSNNTAVAQQATQPPCAPMEVYGRFLRHAQAGKFIVSNSYMEKSGIVYSGDTFRCQDTNEHVRIRTGRGAAPLYSARYISVEHDKRHWSIPNFSGVLLRSTRSFCDVNILENGQEFVFSDSYNARDFITSAEQYYTRSGDYGGIYLANIAERKVGQIALGKDFITLTPRYRQNLWEEME